ncbi:NAD(P)H-dependent oxidoreductase [Muricauda sp. CAU 1633]|uniref:FMN-dependent NADH-azoreductase n=1 Tax=Allomuricauda sp. CAU 1633 TaxID=2816036 RepID=UPI001A8E18E8|nr:NAD(P)H-dependent oxidoreductase [Muricauda sp. CAU 1633]MBO0321913.1 NAD(P)H-dependent oxidoreductase [Muricauda sp. CAU 1633]
MKTLLRIDSSFNLEDSFSRKAADHYEAVWKEHHPESKVVYRDLEKFEMPHLTQSVFSAFNTTEADENGLHISNVLIDELESADTVLISSPVYNYSTPSTLKAYIDHVVRINRTFGYDPENYTRKGLLTGKDAAVIVSRGGMPINGESPDGVEGYLQGVLNFIGIVEVNIFSIHGTAHEGSANRFRSAKEQISQCFNGN